MGSIGVKEADLVHENTKVNKVPRLDLHGFSLEQANKTTKDFIIKSFNNGCKKILIVTGKGSRSKSYDNPYLSEKLSTLKYSIPDYLNNDESLINKISKISKADLKDGGEGAIYIFFKNIKKLIE